MREWSCEVLQLREVSGHYRNTVARIERGDDTELARDHWAWP
jgi:hypothetical protein